MSNSGPPKIASWLIKLFSSDENYSPILFSVEEEYYEILEKKGKVIADAWFRIQTIKSIPRFIKLNIYWGVTMFKNYFKTALRNLYKHKLNSFINVLGMAVGLSVCFLLLMLVQDELSYDRYHEKAPRIFRLLEKGDVYRPPTEAPLLKENFPEIEEVARLLPRDKRQIQFNDKLFIESKFTYADASLFKIFSFNFLRGEPETALTQPFSIVITDETSKKYFGSDNPIGKILRVDNEYDYTVSGVIEKIPNNSHFHFDFIATLENAEDIFGDFIYNWGWQNFPTYYLLKENVSTATLAEKFNKFIIDFAASRSYKIEMDLSLQNIRDTHLYSENARRDIEPQSSIIYVIIFSSIAVFILLIACFNYINILIANATTRLKEVGIKKVIGATRSQLTHQFLMEALFQFAIAFVLAIAIIIVTLPYFNSFTSKALMLANLLSIENVLAVVSILSITILIAGGYPARLISSFQPTVILKGLKTVGGSKNNVRRLLVITQFTISIILTVGAVIMFRQLGFLYQSNLGYDKELVVMSEIVDPEDNSKYETIKEALLQNRNISMVSAADRVPSGELNNYSNFKSETNTEKITMPIVHTNYDYFEIFGINPIKGRLFSEELKTDSDESIILNESAVQELGLGNNPLGKSIFVDWANSNRTVIGVVKDFYFESLYSEIKPTAFLVQSNRCYNLIMKIKPDNIPATLSFIEDTWKGFYPDWVFEYKFIDERYEAAYKAEEKTFQLMGYFTFLAIFIASLGLFGLVSLSTKSKIKEIGIRKVLGSPVSNILSILTVEYVKWILFAFIVASPVAYYFMSQWLQNFAYQIKISWLDFVMAGLFTTIVAVLTVGWQSFKAARTNPINSIKYE